MCTKSLQGNLYFTTFIDDYSSQGVVYGLKSKDQLKLTLEEFLAWLQNTLVICSRFSTQTKVENTWLKHFKVI